MEEHSELFSIYTPEFLAGHAMAKAAMDKINAGAWESEQEKLDYLRVHLGAIGENFLYFEPLNFVNGKNLFFGNNVFISSNITFIDAAPIFVGDHTMIAPGCVITTVGHPKSAKQRRGFMSYAAPITIGKDVWIGTNCTIFPGVTIGDNVIVGANSVVNKDIPSNCVVAGAPARLIREVDAVDDAVD